MPSNCGLIMRLPCPGKNQRRGSSKIRKGAEAEGMRIGGMVESMEVGEQAGAYLVTPGTAPTLHARLRFRLLIRLLFPTLGRPRKELTDGSGHKGPSGTFGQGCLWEVQAGTVTRPQETQNQSLVSCLPTPGPDQPPTWPFLLLLPSICEHTG